MSLTFLLTSIGVFFVTDTDDLIVLLLLWLTAKSARQKRAIVIGQYLGITTLIAVAWIISRGIIHFNVVHWARWFGLIPLFLGIWGLKTWWQHRDTTDLPPQLTKSIRWPLVWAITISNGGDNLSIYIPYFTHLTTPQFASVGLIFLIMVGLWLLLSHQLAKSAIASRFFARFGAWLSPLLFIGIGLLILL